MAAHVLIVEDDRVLAELVQELLRDEGYVVQAAPNGAAALECVTQQRQPDVVLLDLRMPGDGWGLHRGLSCRGSVPRDSCGAHDGRTWRAGGG
jgi:CheY-like chemotaxis protein